jgi:hypothetical protein
MKRALSNDFRVDGAGEEGANGRYCDIARWSEMRAEYINLSDTSYRIRWSTEDGAWVLFHDTSGAMYVIDGRNDQVFPHDAKWSLHKKMSVSTLKKVIHYCRCFEL